jgi:hypothetical protein
MFFIKMAFGQGFLRSKKGTGGFFAWIANAWEILQFSVPIRQSLNDGDDLGQGTPGIVKGLARLQELPQSDQKKLQIITMIYHEE